MKTFGEKYEVSTEWNPVRSEFGHYEGYNVAYRIPETGEAREVCVPQGASLIETVTRDALKA